MNQLKKWLSSMVCAVMLLGLLSGYSAYALEPLDTELSTAVTETVATPPRELIIESYSVAELDNHPEVIKRLEDAGIYDDIITTYDSLLKNPDAIILENVNKILSEPNSDIAPLTMSELQSILDIYGREDAYNSLKSEASAMQILLIDSPSSKAVSNIGVIMTGVDASGIEVYLVQVGIPVNITGSIVGYRLNQKNWSSTPIFKDSFKKYAIGNGSAYYVKNAVEYVKEKFDFDVTISCGTESKREKNSVYRYNFTAGAYNDITANGGQRHHYVSQDALKAYDFNVRKAWTIRMMAADHLKLSNSGSGTKAQNFRNQEKLHLKNKTYQNLLDMEMADFAAQSDSDGYFKNLKEKYRDEIIACTAAYQKMFGIF